MTQEFFGEFRRMEKQSSVRLSLDERLNKREV
jgi:hypothetical protein